MSEASRRSEDYEFVSFQPGFDGEEPDRRTSEWTQQLGLAFHDQGANNKQLAFRARGFSEDNWQLYGAYARDLPATALPGPVATFAQFEKTFNPGAGPIPACLISGVTVRPTHRRRGFLRTMMHHHLASAAQDGYSTALLFATEGGIYRRFGFGAAAYQHEIEVDTTDNFALLHPTSGRVELTDAKNLMTIAPSVFDQFHRQQPGSIDRLSRYRGIIAGLADRTGNADPTIRAALHYDDSGDIDGYVSYKFAGWSVTPRTVDVIDLVATAPSAYLALWEFLAAIDLVERVRWPNAPADDPLAAALADPRVVRATGTQDELWMRILDAGALLASRRYLGDGDLVLRVDDPLGYTSGQYELAVRDGVGHVHRTEAGGAHDIACDIADLATFCLGTSHPATLSAAGRITEGRTGGVAAAAAVFVPSAPVYCNTDF